MAMSCLCVWRIRAVTAALVSRVRCFSARAPKGGWHNRGGNRCLAPRQSALGAARVGSTHAAGHEAARRAEGTDHLPMACYGTALLAVVLIVYIRSIDSSSDSSSHTHHPYVRKRLLGEFPP